MSPYYFFYLSIQHYLGHKGYPKFFLESIRKLIDELPRRHKFDFDHGCKERLKVLQKRVTRKQNGSKNREKVKQKFAVLHEKITNWQNDFEHKLSFKLVIENQAIAVETLNVKDRIKNNHFAQSIGDLVWSNF